MRTLSRVAACALAVLAACERDFALGPRPQAGIQDLEIAPPRAGRGTTVTVGFTVTGTPSADPVVTVGASRARLSAGSTEGRFAFAYQVTGQEPQEVPVSVEVSLPGATGPNASASGEVVFEFEPPTVTSVAAAAPVASPAAPVSLRVEASEPLAYLAASLREDALDLPCAPESGALWTCAATLPAGAASGPRSATFELRDLAGNVRLETRSGLFAVDAACEQKPGLAWHERSVGLPSTFRAEPGAFEPLAEVTLEAESGNPRRVLTALADGSVGRVELEQGFDAGLLVASRDAAGNACPAEAPRRRVVAGFDAVAQGLPGGSSLRALELSARRPSLESLTGQGKAATKDEYAAVSGPGGAAASSESLASAQASWRLAAPGPQVRSGSAFALHEETGEAVLFGGQALGGAPMADTLFLVGDDWVSRRLAAEPPPRHGAQMAYDSARRALVLVGGLDLSGRVNDTWTFDGAAWRKAETTESPPVSGKMAFDRARERMVMLQRSATTPAFWEWDGTAWSRTPVAAADCGPAGRETAPFAMVFDEVAGRVVMLVRASEGGFRFQAWTWDGQTCALAGSVAAEGWDLVGAYFDKATGKTFGVLSTSKTLEWSNGTLSLVAPAASPPFSGVDVSTAWDPARERLLVRTNLESRIDLWQLRAGVWSRPGARALSLNLRDPSAQDGSVQLFSTSAGVLALARTIDEGMQVFRWTGVRWVPQFPARLDPTGVALPERGGSGAAFDPVRNELVLFGGLFASDDARVRRPLDATWRWSGEDGSWTELPAAAIRPSPRYRHGMAYDAAGKRILLFGGRDQFGVPLGDTWSWDGAAWKKLAPVSSPPPRFGHAMLAGPGGEVYLHGGSGLTEAYLADLWRWDGAAWRQVAAGGLPGRRFHAMAWEPGTERFFVFGGQALSPLRDAWEWTGSRWAGRDLLDPPSPRFSVSAAWDPGRGEMLVLGGTAVEPRSKLYSYDFQASPEGGDTHAVEVRHRWPAFLAHLDLAELPESAAATVHLAAGASGFEDEPAPIEGVEVFFWSADLGWVPVARLPSGLGGSAPEAARIALSAELKARFVRGGGLDVLLTAEAPASAQGPSRLALDLLSVVAEQ